MAKHLLSRTGTRTFFGAPGRALHRLTAIGHLIRYGEGRSAVSVRRFD